MPTPFLDSKAHSDIALFACSQASQLSGCPLRTQPYRVSHRLHRNLQGLVRAEGPASTALKKSAPALSPQPSGSKSAPPNVPPTGAEGNAQTNTGSVDPLATSTPPKPSSLPGTSGESPTAANKLPDAATRSAVESPSSTSLDGAASSLKQSAEKAADAAKDSAGGSLGQGSDTVSDQAGAVSDAIQSATQPGNSLGDSLQAATDASSQQGQGAGGGASFLESFENARNSLVDKANESASATADSLQGLTGNLREQLTSIQEEFSKQFAGASDAAGGSLQDVGSQVGAASAAATNAANSAAAQISDSTASALQGLPPPVREALYTVGRPVLKTLSNPQVAYPAAGVLITLQIFGWISDRIGGYAGQLQASDAVQMLEGENSLLLDVRTEDSRERSGTPDLRYGARTRGIAFPLVQISRRSGTQVVKADVLPFQLAAAMIQGLKKVNWQTKVIVLDDSPTRPIKLARALSDLGIKAYVLKGGMKGWVSSGLLVKESTEYDSSSLDGLNDTVQGRVLPTITDPIIGPLAISLGVTAAAAVYDIHKTLQFIGIFALLANVGTAPLRYSSIEEAKNDIFWPFLWIGGLASKLVPATRPGSAPMLAEGQGIGADIEGEESFAQPVVGEIDDGYDGIREGSSSEEVEQPLETAERSETRV